MAHGAVAVDLGASSARFAAGSIVGDRIRFEIIEQVKHEPIEHAGKLVWDFDALLGICERAAAYAAAHFDEASLAIDGWGVDHGFVGKDGCLLGAPVCYRDPSHQAAFESISEEQPRLYRLTGVQRQPFNTLCQLIARRREDPSLPERARWLLLPDLLAVKLGGAAIHELTNASTTQLLDLSGNWCREAFELAGWPVPAGQQSTPGRVLGKTAGTVDLIAVGSHDTASAVCGLGALAEDEAFLNIGTWSLLGCLTAEPIATQEAESANFTNERAVDGRIRFLANVPGFYVINRIHDELGTAPPVPDWLAGADRRYGYHGDLLSPEFFNPPSMIDALRSSVPAAPTSKEQWAALALNSVARTCAKQLAEMERATGRTFKRIRAGGGGSQSAALCQAIADESAIPVVAGPAEATVLGNLAVQMLARRLVSDFGEMERLVDASTEGRTFEPRRTG